MLRICACVCVCELLPRHRHRHRVRIKLLNVEVDWNQADDQGDRRDGQISCRGYQSRFGRE